MNSAFESVEPALCHQCVWMITLAVMTAVSISAGNGKAECLSTNPPFSISKGLAVGDCSQVDPKTVDIRQTDQEMRACTLADGAKVQAFLVRADILNPRVRITRGTDPPHEFVVEPRIEMESPGFSMNTMLTCDSGRFYILHPFLGYLSAFDANGNQLWQRQLPGFVQLPATAKDKESVFASHESSTSLGMQNRASGDFIAAEFRTGGRGTFQVVFHRSGLLVGQLGPWDGRILEPAAGGWKIVAGGGWDLRFFIPKEQYELRVTDTSSQSIVRHAIAWLQPRPIDKTLTFQCLSREDDEIRYWLKDAYNLEHARTAKTLLIRVGGASWFDELVKAPPVAEVVQRFDPVSAEWQQDFVAAIIEAGGDIDIAAALEGMPSAPGEKVRSAQ